MNKTPLFERHVAMGATMAEFGGWDMPLWYKTGQTAEHKATRENCGLFDICHMGEYIITGKDSFPRITGGRKAAGRRDEHENDQDDNSGIALCR